MFRIGGGSSKVLPSYTIDLEQVDEHHNIITLLQPRPFFNFYSFGTETQIGVDLDLKIL